MAIEPADNPTIDSPLPAKRGRGRPPTGTAKTSAQRMREHRSRVRQGETGEKEKGGERELSLKLSLSAYGALTRLAKHDGLTKKDFLDRLLLTAERELLTSMDSSSPEWQSYFS